uniref:Ionotropic glutamate receptor C-terminal domain-containing protein n=1 Tax=Stomoxys calcitrans TaxID=35570 RepID=A0A2Y9D4S6_STOCA
MVTKILVCNQNMMQLLLYTLVLLPLLLAEGPEDILKAFQMIMDIRTILVFNPYETDDFWHQAYNLSSQAKLVITNQNASDLREFLGERVLSVVFVQNLDQLYLEEIFKPSLLNLHQRDVLFLTNDTLESADQWQWLFQWCFLQGFWNVLLKGIKQQPYLTMDCIPEMVVKFTSLEHYFHRRHHRVSNLRGIPIKVTIGNYPPRVYADFDETGELQLGGFYGNAVKIFAAQFNVTLDYVFMPNMSHYSVLSCVEFIEQQWADICADAVLFGMGIETTRPIYIVFSYLLVPFDKPLENYEYFRKPFDNLTWGIIGFTFICLSSLVIVVEYKEHRRLSLVDNLFRTFESFIGGSSDLGHISQNYRYALEFLLIFCGFMIGNIYLAYLSSILLTKIYRKEIRSIHDIIAHNMSILTSTYQQYILELTDASPLVRQQTIIVSEEMIDANLRQLNPEYVYFALDIEMDFYLYQQQYMTRPRMKKLSDFVITSDMGEVPMRSYWPFQDLFTDFMDNLFCSGISGYLFEESTLEGLRSGQITYFPTEGMSVVPLSLEYFILCGLILAGGYIMSLLCFIIENLVYRKISARNRNRKILFIKK